MINERILNEFRQHDTSPQYIMLITDIKNGEVVCNEESLIISGKQIFLSLDEYLNGIDKVLEKNEIDPTEMSEYLENLSAEDLNKIEEYLKGIGKFIKYRDNNIKTIEKDLTIYSNVTLDDNNLYYGQLNGYISNEKVNEINKNSNNQSSHYIEMVDVILQKEVDITFSQPYKNPKIAITIDEKDEDIYTRIVPKLIKEREEDEKYIGVKITFTNLRNRSSYPKIGVLIIGDEKEETYNEEGNIEPTYHNLTVNLYQEKINEENDEIEHIPIENVSILINEKEFQSDKCGTITGLFEEGEYEIKIKDSGYKYTPKTVILDSDKTIGLKLLPGIIATFSGNEIKLNSGWKGNIDWGDGNTDTSGEYPFSNNITHIYENEDLEHDVFIEAFDFENDFTKILNFRNAFSSCKNLISIKISKQLEELSSNCFDSCSNLKKIIFSKPIKKLTLNPGCFSRCNNLEEIIFPETLENLILYENSFIDCYNLKEIIFPETTKSIILNQYCFANCSRLNKIIFPKTMKDLAINSSFAGCTNLQQIIFPETINNFSIEGDNIFTQTNLLRIVFPFSTNIYSLPNNLFYNIINLQEIILSESITELGENCFFGTRFREISLPKSITNIKANAFRNTNNPKIILNWINEDIIQYNRTIYNTNVLEFSIPPNTKNNYIEKGYPENKLVERVSDEDDSS